MKVIPCIVMCLSLLVIACSKKPLALDESTSMKDLLRASDREITELAMREATKRLELSREDISVGYILRDKKSQALAVKVSKNQ